MANDTPPDVGYAVLVEDSNGDYKRIFNVFSVKYDDPSIVLTDVPKFEVETDNITGRRLGKFGVGKGCKIYRNGTLVFYGEIEPRVFSKGSAGSTMKFSGKQQGYAHLQNRVCDYYRADNNSYAPYVNPWRFGRKTDDDNVLVDGLRPDEIMQNLIGTKFIWQEWFDNHDYLKHNVYSTEEVEYESCTINAAIGALITNVKWSTQECTTGTIHAVRTVMARLWRDGGVSDGYVNCAIYNEAGGGGPGTVDYTAINSITATDLPGWDATIKGNWFNFTFSGDSTVSSDSWFITIWGSGISSGQCFWVPTSQGDGSSYPNGNRWYTTCSGDSWSNPVNPNATDLHFREFGYASVSPLIVNDGQLELPKTPTVGDTADSYATTGAIQSVGLYNGDKNIDVMGTISTVTAKLVGTLDSTFTPELYVCRDMDDAQTWTQITTTYDGSSIWTGTTVLSGSETYKNQFGYYIAIEGDATASTQIDYAKFDCDTVSDTSITAGTIDQYNDPNTTDDTIAINLAGMNRLEALEKVRLLTSTSTVYTDINWDAYVDNSLQFHFTTVRGEDVSKTFSFDNQNLTLLKQSYDGEIKNALIAVGQGEEPYAVTLVGSEMKDATSITTYGQKTGYFIDKSIPDAPTLYKRAKAYLKYMKDPRENLEVDICNDPTLNWDVGDRIHITDTELDVDDDYRVLARAITKGQDSDERINIELGTKSNSLGGLLRNIQDRFSNQEVITQGTGSPTNTLAAGLVYDTSQAAEYPFYIPANAQRVVVSVKTHKYRAYSKASSSSESSHTHTITGEATDETAAGLANLWSNPQSRLNVEVAANSELEIRCNTVIPAYEGRLFAWCRANADAAGTLGRVEFAIGDASEPTGWFSEFLWTDYTNDDDYMDGLMLAFTAGSGFAGSYFWAVIYNPTDAAQDYDIDWWVYKELPHDHDITGVATGAGSAHTHAVDFGIYEFGYYPAKTSMKIDSTNNAIVDKFGYMGDEDTSTEVIDLDITDNLRNSAGKIVEGLHTLYFQSQTSGNNAEGLGIIAVSHKITVNTSTVDLEPLP